MSNNSSSSNSNPSNNGSCWHSIRLWLQWLGIPGIVEPLKLEHDETRQAAVMREVAKDMQISAAANADMIKRHEKLSHELNKKIKREIRDAGGLDNMTPTHQMRLAGLIQRHENSDNYIAFMESQDNNHAGMSTTLEMGAHMMKQQRVMTTAIKKLKSTGLTNTFKIEKSLMEDGEALEKIIQSVNSYAEFGDKQNQNIEKKEIDMKPYMARLKVLDNEVALEYRMKLELGPLPQQRNQEQNRLLDLDKQAVVDGNDDDDDEQLLWYEKQM